ncbi:MAG: hypothetical protein JW895_17895 [Thermoleophilaceae bacterium]|nr:hypothetical protein [Thermoleophilaceae bacterium]
MRLLWLIGAVGISVAVSASAATARPGTLDPTFGEAGVATIRDPFVELVPSFIAEQPDGRPLVFGQLQFPTGRHASAAVYRLTARGRLDRSFGDGGRALLEESPGGHVAMTDGGGLAIASQLVDETTAPVGISVTWLDRDGRRLGATPARFSRGSHALSDIVALPDGGVMVATSNRPTDSRAADAGVELIRFSAARSVDAAFGLGGRVLVKPPYAFGEPKLAVAPGGALLLASHEPNIEEGGGNIVLGRVTPTGSQDLTYGSAGTTVIPQAPRQFQQLNDFEADARGRAVVLVSRLSADAGFSWSVARLDEAGGLVRDAHGASGLVFDLALESDGDAIATGMRDGSDSASTVFRQLGTGRADGTFGRSGAAERRFRSEPFPFALAVQRDGRIIQGVALRGRGAQPDPFVVLRFWGGHDTRPPLVRLRRGCGGRVRTVRVRISDRSRIAAIDARAGGRALRARAQKRLTLRIRRGRRLRLTVYDRSGNRTTRRLALRPCSAQRSSRSRSTTASERLPLRSVAMRMRK